MRYTKIHFHHVPGHEHVHPHGEATKDQTIQLLEYLHHHNEEHALELEGYMDGVGDAEAKGLLGESAAFLNKSNEKLGEAIAVLKKE